MTSLRSGVKLTLMKKLLAILVLGLLWCNVGFANTWEIIEQKNEFEGTSFKYVSSSWVKPNKPLDFPYKDLKAYFWKQCGSDQSVAIGFNKNPNLLGGREASIWENHQRHDVSIKVDGTILKTSGEIGINKTNFKINSMLYPHVNRIINSKSFMIQFDHYGGERHYTFDLSNMPKC